MTEAMIMDMGRNALTIMLILSLPLLGVSLIIGLVVSLFQAITQIQEVTLTFVPKILGIILVTVLLGPWMFQQLLTFTTNLFDIIPRLAA
ncbi:MAG: flagellar biosynthesis protein FliQ [Caldilineaceae bacterium]|nr:flagellar biosynthesis protein FliQ [Caldilineaceae bacterium]HRJ41904.1 flagellar biosynthesis protein FliQ [Caldilineaceae bacterium]